MNKLGNYVLGNWIEGDGDGKPLFNAVNGEVVAAVSTKGLDFAEILAYGRNVGNPALRKMTFQERGNMLKKLALYLTKRKEQFYEISYKTGATRADSWVDIAGYAAVTAEAIADSLSNQPLPVDQQSNVSSLSETLNGD